MPGLPWDALLRPPHSRGTLHTGGCSAGWVQAIAVTAPCQGQLAKISQVSVLPFFFGLLSQKEEHQKFFLFQRRDPVYN